MKLALDKINTAPKTLEEATQVISQLVTIIVELKKENDQLREQLNNNSNNSSLPPSQDIKKKKQIKQKSGRKRGGQPGHPASQRRLIPSHQVDQVIYCNPEDKCDCGGDITLKDKFEIHQVFEIPVPKYEVIEYRITKGCCATCRQGYTGKLPAGVSKKGFGARTQAMISLLTSKYRLSKRLVIDWFRDVYHMPICLGSISNIEHTVSLALAPMHQELFYKMQSEKILHVDETGHKEVSKSGWAWIMSTAKYTCFILNKSRGKKIAKALIGDFQDRIIITDRYPAYNYLPYQNHQLCWAHLKRDFQKISERPGQAGRIGAMLLKSYALLFGFFKTEYAKSAILSKKQKKRLRYLKNKLIKWLHAGADCVHDKTARTCMNILELQHSLWHFLHTQGVPPTNNHAERQLRPLVISKKLTFGTQSARGSRYIERIFSVVMSCKQQGRDILSFLTAAIYQRFGGMPAPSLIA